MHIFSWLRALNCTKPNWYGKWKYNLAAFWLDLAWFWLDWEVSSGFNEASFNFLLLPNDFHALVFSHCLHFLLADFQLVSKAKKSLITAATPPPSSAQVFSYVMRNWLSVKLLSSFLMASDSLGIYARGWDPETQVTWDRLVTLALMPCRAATPPSGGVLSNYLWAIKSSFCNLCIRVGKLCLRFMSWYVRVCVLGLCVCVSCMCVCLGVINCSTIICWHFMTRGMSCQLKLPQGRVCN